MPPCTLSYDCCMATLKHDEARSFRALWNWLTGMDLTEVQLARMANPCDPPDFRFMHEGKSVAVEHTQVFRPTGKASLQPPHDCAIQDRICAHLNELLKQPDSQLSSVALSITFGSCHMVRRADESAIARGVFDLVGKRLGNGDVLPMELFMCDLSDISACLGDVLMMDGGSSSTATRHSFGRVDEWGLTSFQELATRKAKDLPRYADRFDQCWLLLSAGGPHQAQWFEPSQTACATGVKSDFDRVFVVDHHRSEARVYEIMVTA